MIVVQSSPDVGVDGVMGADVGVDVVAIFTTDKSFMGVLEQFPLLFQVNKLI